MAGELTAVRLPHESPVFDPGKVSVRKKLSPNSRFHRTHVSFFLPRRKFQTVVGRKFQAIREDGQRTLLDERGYPHEPSEQDFEFLLWLRGKRRSAKIWLARDAARRIAKQGRALTLTHVYTVPEYMELVRLNCWPKLMGVAPKAWEYTLAYAEEMIRKGTLR